MTKRKKTFIIILSITCCLVVVLSVFFCLYNPQNKNIKFTITDTLPYGNGVKSKVIILAGQSNAAGCSISSYLKKNVSDTKYSEYENGYDNIYINYFSSNSNVSNKFVKTSTNQGDTDNQFGPEVGLAEKLYEMYPNEQFFIIKFTWSGTSLFSQWLSPSSKGKTGYLYSNLIRYVKQSMNYLKSKGYDAKIEGICWMQGESDSFSVENATNYEVNLNNFITDVRKDLSKYADDDGIGFVDATIANNPVFWVYCDLVNQSKQKVSELSENNLLIDTNAIGLVCDQEPEESPDIPHYDSLSQIKLGNTFAEQVSLFFK